MFLITYILAPLEISVDATVENSRNDNKFLDKPISNQTYDYLTSEDSSKDNTLTKPPITTLDEFNCEELIDYYKALI